jgi:NDP-sugar pyrophosphorylase family protein
MEAMIDKTLVVLAAGTGSRYGGLKQMDPVGPNGETILEYSVFDATRAGFDKVVFVIRRDFEGPFKAMVAAWFQGGIQRAIAVEYVFQELDHLPEGFNVLPGRTKPWGTTQAVLAAERAVSTPFAVINADDFYGADSYEVLAQHLDGQLGADPDANADEYAMVGFRLRDTLSDSGAVARGLCQVNGDGLLESIVELITVERCGEPVRSTDAAGGVTMLSGKESVSMNMWGFTPQVFDQLREQFKRFLEKHPGDIKSECYLPNTVNELIRPGQSQTRARVRMLKTSARWFGVTYREDRAQVVEDIQQLVATGAYPTRLWA